MNKARITSQLQLWLAAGGPIANLIIGETGISPERYNNWSAAAVFILPSIIAVIWNWYSNREAGLIKATGELPGVAKVVINDGVNGAVGKMAGSADHPAIVTETQNKLEVMEGQGK